VPSRPDPAELAIFNALFASVAEEMGVTLGRTAHSPNIKERRDYSCAVFDRRGLLVAQAAHIPVHLGAMPASVAAATPLAPFRPGDLVILNDPYLGGTHLPDITMISPVFAGRALAGFVAGRAHHADVGGASPGSMPLAEDLLQEGVVIPPLKLYERGRLNRAAHDLLLRNMRNPDERKGDLDAQTAAQRIGEARFAEIVERYGLPHVRRQMRAVIDYAEHMTRAAISEIPDGVYEFEDFLDDDGVTDDPIPIRLRLTIDSGTIHCDFTGSSEERPSSVNAVAAVTRSAVYYVVRCLLDESVPSNDGCFRPVTFTLPERSVVNAGPPRAVAAGNVETSQRIVDVVLGALAQALPHLIPAASAGTMNNVSIGGWDAERSRSFAYYETVGGGAGAGPSADGLSAVHTHMTNTMNTPVEALELAYPFRLAEYAVRRDSGGRGHHRGGDGIRRTWEFLTPATVSLLTERRRRTPWGLAGGEPQTGRMAGDPGRNLLTPAPNRHPERSEGSRPDEQTDLPSKGEVKVQPGDRLTLDTPGGGGWEEQP
jgi:N-methylhydantoinase B